MKHILRCVISILERAARALDRYGARRYSRLLFVGAGESIQDVIGRAKRWETVVLPPGIYAESATMKDGARVEDGKQ